MSRSGRRLLRWAVTGAVLALVLVLGLSDEGASGGRLAPALPREPLSGVPVTLAALRAAAHGRPTLVVFWASWCEPCRHEAPAVERFARSTAGRGRLVGVDWSDEAGSARRFIRRYRWSFPNLRDGEGTVGFAYGLTGLPTTFVIAADGRIVKTLRGPQTEQTLERAVGSAG